jgi:hypothetical protein
MKLNFVTYILQEGMGFGRVEGFFTFFPPKMKEWSSELSGGRGRGRGREQRRG